MLKIANEILLRKPSLHQALQTHTTKQNFLTQISKAIESKNIKTIVNILNKNVHNQYKLTLDLFSKCLEIFLDDTTCYCRPTSSENFNLLKNFSPNKIDTEIEEKFSSNKSCTPTQIPQIIDHSHYATGKFQILDNKYSFHLITIQSEGNEYPAYIVKNKSIKGRETKKLSKPSTFLGEGASKWVEEHHILWKQDKEWKSFKIAMGTIEKKVDIPTITAKDSSDYYGTPTQIIHTRGKEHRNYQKLDTSTDKTLVVTPVIQPLSATLKNIVDEGRIALLSKLQNQFIKLLIFELKNDISHGDLTARNVSDDGIPFDNDTIRSLSDLQSSNHQTPGGRLFPFFEYSIIQHLNNPEMKLLIFQKADIFGICEMLYETRTGETFLSEDLNLADRHDSIHNTLQNKIESNISDNKLKILLTELLKYSRVNTKQVLAYSQVRDLPIEATEERQALLNYLIAPQDTC